MAAQRVRSVESLIPAVQRDYRRWRTKTLPWFRGEPEDTEHPLVPKLFRRRHSENSLLQHFRMKAPTLGMKVPPRDHTDQWLSLARHVGVPTRLLNWSEGLLPALYFALQDRAAGGAIWMLDPVELNRQSVPAGGRRFKDNEFPLTWHSPDTAALTRKETVNWLQVAASEGSDAGAELAEIAGKMRSNIGQINVRLAWEGGEARTRIGTLRPIAIHPTGIHPRMSAQKSCFTIFGRNHQSLQDQVGPRILTRYILDRRAFPAMLGQMQLLGVTYSALFPDLDGLGRDLERLF
jgi:hypothetical protein